MSINSEKNKHINKRRPSLKTKKYLENVLSEISKKNKNVTTHLQSRVYNNETDTYSYHVKLNINLENRDKDRFNNVSTKTFEFFKDQSKNDIIDFKDRLNLVSSLNRRIVLRSIKKNIENINEILKSLIEKVYETKNLFLYDIKKAGTIDDLKRHLFIVIKIVDITGSIKDKSEIEFIVLEKSKAIKMVDDIINIISSLYEEASKKLVFLGASEEKTKREFIRYLYND